MNPEEKTILRVTCDDIAFLRECGIEANPTKQTVQLESGRYTRDEALAMLSAVTWQI